MREEADVARTRYWVPVVLLSVVAVLCAGCGDDPAGPSNAAPEITGLAADPATVDPAGYCTVTCTANEPDGDDLSFTWGSSIGSVSGSGSAVTWYGPMDAGNYDVWVTVDDGQGKTDSDTVSVEVRGGTLLVQATGQVLAVDMYGDYFTLYGSNVEIEVVGTRIFTGPYGVREIDHSGNVIDEIPRPPGSPSRVTGFAAFDGGFAFLENWGDTVTFVSESGTLIENVVMPEASPINQGLKAVVVGDKMIISETGTRKLVQAYLMTREMSIFKDMTQLSSWLGDIDYSDGKYYLTQYEDIFEFTETSEPQVLYNKPDGFMLHLTVVGRYVYATDRNAGTIHRVDIFSGEAVLLVGGLPSPRDIEFLPVSLQAP
jgi:hypothetical protein